MIGGVIGFNRVESSNVGRLSCKGAARMAGANSNSSSWALTTANAGSMTE